MKKLLILSLLLYGLYAQADSKNNYIDISGGLSAGGISALPVFSLGYGRHIINSNSYLGFIGINLGSIVVGKSRLPIMAEVKYGYEFMRNNTFSFGLDILALIIEARTVTLRAHLLLLAPNNLK